MVVNYAIHTQFIHMSVGITKLNPGTVQYNVAIDLIESAVDFDCCNCGNPKTIKSANGVRLDNQGDFSYGGRRYNYVYKGCYINMKR